MSNSIPNKKARQTHPQFKISHNSIPKHFSYFNPYKDEYQQRRPTHIFNAKFQRNWQQNSQLNESSPGPGNYDISLPIVKPKYSTIFKNNNSIILKLNDTAQGTSSFKSKLNRFHDLQVKSPGPGSYSQNISKRLNSQQREKHKQKLIKEKQQQRKIKQKYLQSIMRQQKVETIKNYVAFDQRKNSKRILGRYRYAKQFSGDSMQSIQQSLYQRQKSLNSERNRLPLTRSVNKSMKIERQGFPIFYAPQKLKDSCFQLNEMSKQQSYIDSYRDLYVGLTKKQLRMSIDSQTKFSNTFYNRQLLDVILRRKVDQQNTSKMINQNSGLLDEISEVSMANGSSSISRLNQEEL